MSTETLPAEVLRFLVERIDTVPHLEALLIIWQSGSRWDARQLSERIYLPQPATQLLLQDLQRAGLLVSDDAVRFGFDATDDMRQLMSQVDAAYRRNISRVSTLIHHKASSSVREFARAFDFRKDR